MVFAWASRAMCWTRKVSRALDAGRWRCWQSARPCIGNIIPEELSEVTPEVAARYDGLYVNTPKVTSASVGRETAGCGSWRGMGSDTTRSMSRR